MKKEEAIKILRGVHDNAIFSVRNALETLIPELAESEDERIREEIRNFLIDMECKEEWIAYLEKQKEQNPAEWSKEDESNLQSCIAKIEIDMQHWDKHGKTMVDGDIKLIDWLKSLRPLKLSVDDVRLLHGLIQGVEKEATGAFTARRLPIEKYQLVLDRFLAIKNKSV